MLRPSQLSVMLSSLVAAAFHLLLAGCASVPPLPAPVDGDPRTPSLEAFFTDLHARDAFHGNVVVAEGGRTLFVGSYGVADDATGRPLTRTSVLELASVGKAFTAMAICILHEEGALDLEDRVVAHIGDFPYPDVCIRHLLTHTGGVPDAYPTVLEGRTTIATNADLRAALAELPPSFEPGERFEYSNTGYVMLAEVIETVSGRPFETFLEERIFAPCGMRNTRAYATRFRPSRDTVVPGAGEVIPDYAFGYFRDAGVWVMPTLENRASYAVLLSGVQGDGNVISTIDDMLRWDRALRERSLISEETWQRAIAPVPLADGSTSTYGFGWGLDADAAGNLVLTHTGGWPGTQALIRRTPAHERLVFYVKNRETFDWSWLGELFSIVDGDPAPSRGNPAPSRGNPAPSRGNPAP